MRAAWGLVLLLGCACGPAPSRPALLEPALDPALLDPALLDPALLAGSLRVPAPLPASQLAALRAAAVGSGALYWRLRGPDGPRCERWTFEPDLDDPTRGHLLHNHGPVRLRFAHQIADGRLRLHSPEREREQLTGAGALSTTVVALPCVPSAMSLTPLGQATPGLPILTSHARWFLSLDACTAAGPDLDPQPPAPGELHPLGCPAALADLGTRTREDLPAAPTPASARLWASERLYWLRERDGRRVCERWQHQRGDLPQRGLLRHHDRAGSTVYVYALGPALLTLLGPTRTRRLRGPTGPAELTHAHGCLLTRPFTLTAHALRFGDDLWYLRRRDCERARQAPRLAQPDPDCHRPASPP